jgi:hypothetical protein
VCVLTVSCSSRHTRIHVEISPSPVRKRSLCSCQFASSRALRPTHSPLLCTRQKQNTKNTHSALGREGKRKPGVGRRGGMQLAGVANLVNSLWLVLQVHAERAHPPECGLPAGRRWAHFAFAAPRPLQNAPPPPRVDNLAAAALVKKLLIAFFFATAECTHALTISSGKPEK